MELHGYTRDQLARAQQHVYDLLREQEALEHQLANLTDVPELRAIHRAQAAALNEAMVLFEAEHMATLSD